MKKAELNQIKRAAFDKWAEFPENIELLKFASCVTCWRVEEGTEVKLLQTTTDSQLNTNYLKKNGFGENARISKLFVANAKTKCLTAAGN